MFVRGPRGVCPKKNKIPVSFFWRKVDVDCNCPGPGSEWFRAQLQWSLGETALIGGQTCLVRETRSAGGAVLHHRHNAQTCLRNIHRRRHMCWHSVYKLAFRKNTSYGHIYILYSVSICRLSGFCIAGCTAHLLAVKYCCRPKQTDVQVSQLQKSINHKISW